jgi:uncharacterized protein (TIGR02147 family)
MSKTPKQTLQTISAEIDVTRYLSHRDFLRELYLRAKDNIIQYSYLRFAEDLGFSATNVMRLIIVGQRNLSSKAAEKIAIQLNLTGGTRRYWTNLIKYTNARSPADRDRYFKLMMGYKTQARPKQLKQSQVEYYKDWYNPVIREMVALPDFDGTPEWIKAKLNFPLRREEITAALELLLKLGEISEIDGKYSKLKANNLTDSEVDDIAIVRYHQQMIEIGKESITRAAEEERDIRALTVRLPEERVLELKTKIEGWLHEVLGMENAENNQHERIYQLNVQLFPFTKGSKS